MARLPNEAGKSLLKSCSDYKEDQHKKPETSEDEKKLLGSLGSVGFKPAVELGAITVTALWCTCKLILD